MKGALRCLGTVEIAQGGDTHHAGHGCRFLQELRQTWNA
jgi:hypothetical protein